MILSIVSTIEEANQLETAFILEYNTLSPNGYNLCTGGDNKIISLETKQRISEAKQGEKNPQFGKEPWNKGLTKDTSSILLQKSINQRQSYIPENHPNFNKSRSIETKQKISAGLSNKPKSDDHKQKLSDINKGKILSTETKQKMSAARKGRICPVLICPHCGKEGKGSAMYKWHFTNCPMSIFEM